MEVTINIFYISTSPQQAAEWMVDRHVVKMILETAQLLSTAHRVLDGEEILGKSKTGRSVKRYILHDERDTIMYQATHINHPSAIWTRTAVENYLWLVEHFYALLDEYKYRYQKTHKCTDLAYHLQSPPQNLREFDQTEMPCAMDVKYIIAKDPVVNYQNYYRHGKFHLHSYTRRQAPPWLTD